MDKGCGELIYGHQSGFCECGAGVKTSDVGCDSLREPFTCQSKCGILYPANAEHLATLAAEATRLQRVCSTARVKMAVLDASKAPTGTLSAAQADLNQKCNAAAAAAAASAAAQQAQVLGRTTEVTCTPVYLDVPERSHNSTPVNGMSDTNTAFWFADTARDDNGNFVPRRCLDGRIASPGAWCAYANTPGTWYTLDAGTSRRIVGVAMKGRGDASQWVTSFKVSATLSGEAGSWQPVDNGTVFTGNSDSHTVIEANFAEPITTRFVRIHPISWHQHMSLRVELRACTGEGRRCGSSLSATSCALLPSSGGGAYSYSEGVSSDDPGRFTAKTLAYPDDVTTFGGRGASSAGIWIGRGVTVDQCARACDGDPVCRAFTRSDGAECWLQAELDGTVMDWKGRGTIWTTYYKAEAYMTNMVPPAPDDPDIPLA